MTPDEVQSDHQQLDNLRSRLIERLQSIEDEHSRLTRETEGISVLLSRIQVPSINEHGQLTASAPQACNAIPTDAPKMRKGQW